MWQDAPVAHICHIFQAYYLRLLLLGSSLLRPIILSYALGSKLVLHKATGRNENLTIDGVKFIQ